MITLRDYLESDAKHICSWIKDEVTFRNWCADQYERFPILPSDINEKYEAMAKLDGFFPLIATDDGRAVGHLIMRYTDAGKEALRFGFVIVDDSMRGKGYGKIMLSLALKRAFEETKAKTVTIGVFENNLPAYHCYRTLGFAPTGESRTYNHSGESRSYVELSVSNSSYHRTCGQQHAEN